MRQNIVFLFSVISFSVAAAEEPQFPNPVMERSPFVNKLAELAGPFAQDCGLVPLGVETTSALSCARKMLRGHKPFLVGVQLQGTDSYIWNGVAADPSGHLSYVFFDSDVTGGFGHKPKMSVSSCDAVSLPGTRKREFRCLRKP